MKNMILSLLCVFALSAMASSIRPMLTLSDHDGEGPTDWCSMQGGVCSSSAGSNSLSYCSVECYHGQRAICTPGYFEPGSCEIAQDNTCYCY